MADDRHLPDQYPSGPYFEPIGQEADGLPPDDTGIGSAGGHVFRPALRAAAADWWVAVRTLRFWAFTLGAGAGVWTVAGVFQWLSGGADGSAGSMPASLPAYLVALVLVPAAAAIVGTHWGMACCRRPPGPGQPPGQVTPILASAMRSLVFALLTLPGLLVQAAAAGQPGTLAVLSAAVAAVETVVFSSMGVAMASLLRRPAAAAAAGWALTLFLVAGGVAACALLVPAVRSEEPVTVAMNVQRAREGVLLAYDCSRVPAGTAEVYRTERIMWLAAPSPSVLFVMLAGEQDAGKDQFGWQSSRLQEAADGTQVPCVNGEPLGREAARVPLDAAGLMTQAGLAAVLLGGAHVVSRRRRPQENSGTAQAAAGNPDVRPGHSGGLRRRVPRSLRPHIRGRRPPAGRTPGG